MVMIPHKISWKFHSMMSSSRMAGCALLALNEQHSPTDMILHEKEKHKELPVGRGRNVCVARFPSFLCSLHS